MDENKPVGVLSFRKSGESDYLAEFLLQDNFRGNLVIPITNLTLAKKSFRYRVGESWNIIPEAIRSIEAVRLRDGTAFGNDGIMEVD